MEILNRVPTNPISSTSGLFKISYLLGLGVESETKVTIRFKKSIVVKK